MNYVDLITSEHRKAPKYAAMVELVSGAFGKTAEVAESMIDKFDVDNARGDQLDILAKWIGAVRAVPVPIKGLYFTWGDTALTGWGSGRWKGVGDPDDGISTLSDSEMRVVLRLKIAANAWDGTSESMYEAFKKYLGSKATFRITDNQDMTVTIDILSNPDGGLTEVEKALINMGAIPFKPCGVKVIYNIAQAPRK